MLNSFTVQGNLVETPVLTTAKNNPESTYCNFTIACNRNDKQGSTDYFRCTAFGNVAAFIANWFVKGQQILLTGEVHINAVQDKNGKKYYTNVTVKTANFCGHKSKSAAVPKIIGPDETDQAFELLFD